MFISGLDEAGSKQLPVRVAVRNSSRNFASELCLGHVHAPSFGGLLKIHPEFRALAGTTSRHAYPVDLGHDGRKIMRYF